MKVLVTGSNGQLGFDVVKQLKLKGFECKGVDSADFDLTDEKAVSEGIASYKPAVVVHCAAYTAVDKAESDTEACNAVNDIGTSYVANACKAIGAKLVYISTDYVFSGTGTQAFRELDQTAPINAYGMSKLKGEEAVKSRMEQFYIVRISWAFGINGNNFVKTMLRLAESKSEISVVSDQIGSPTYTVDLAKLVVEMIQTDRYGVYHATNEDYCSWAEFAEEIFKISEKQTIVNRICSSEYPTPAKRPLNSRLSKCELDANGFSRLPNWKDALQRYLLEIEAK